MSDSDFEDSPHPSWLGSESDPLRHSLVDSTNSTLGVNVSPHSANNKQVRALVHGDSNISGPASNRGTSVGNAPLEGTGSDKEEEFLEYPTQTTPQSKSPFIFPFHCGWSMGRGRGMGRGGVNSTVCTNRHVFFRKRRYCVC